MIRRRVKLTVVLGVLLALTAAFGGQALAASRCTGRGSALIESVGGPAAVELMINRSSGNGSSLIE